jgi:hypothetical protein
MMRMMEQTEMLRWGSRVDTHFHTLRPINVEFALIDNMIQSCGLCCDELYADMCYGTLPIKVAAVSRASTWIFTMQFHGHLTGLVSVYSTQSIEVDVGVMQATQSACDVRRVGQLSQSKQN